MIASDTRGHGPRIALVHGFGQTGACWGPLAEALERDHQVVRVDAPGHGRSRALVGSLAECAGWLADAVGPAIWIGYSMGGRMALQLALDRPHVVHGLLLIAATAGIEDDAARRARKVEDEATARALIEQGSARFFAEWVARPMFAGVPERLRFQAEREAQDPRALAALLEAAGTGSMTPLWDRLRPMRALFVAGAEDRVYAAHAVRMARETGGRAALITGAGHAAHLEQPAAVEAEIRSFIAR